MDEEGLYDFVIFNGDLDDALAQLREIADQALAGLAGQGTLLSKARAAAVPASPDAAPKVGTNPLCARPP